MIGVREAVVDNPRIRCGGHLVEKENVKFFSILVQDGKYPDFPSDLKKILYCSISLTF